MRALALRSLFLVSLGLLFYSELCAQKFIAIDKGGRNKRIRFYTGEYMSLKTKDGEFHKGNIIQIDSIDFVLGMEKIKLNEIEVVYKKTSRYGLSLLSNVTLIAGLGFFAIDSGNRLINSENPIVRRETIKLSSGLLGVSVLSSLLTKKKYKIGERHPIKIIDLNI